MSTFFSFYHSTIIIAALLAVTTSAFTRPSSTTTGNTASSKADDDRKTTTLQMVSRDEFLRPHFQAAAAAFVSAGAPNGRQRGGFLRPRFNNIAPTGASTFRSSPRRDPILDRRVLEYCESKGGCDSEEMEQLMEEEFRKLNQESSCSSDLLSFGSQPEPKQAEEVPAPKGIEDSGMKQYLRRMHDIAEREEV